MLGGYWIIITLLLVIAAAVLNQGPILLVALLFFLTSGAARLWSRYVLERVDYDQRLSAHRIFPGETVTLETSLANRKFLPLPWVRIENELPEDVVVANGKMGFSHLPGRSYLSGFMSLNWYHKLIRRYQVRFDKRGYYKFGPTVVHAGDPFGFFNREMTVQSIDYLTVYPRILPLEQTGLPSKYPFGDTRVRRHLIEDPLRTVTTREYIPGDSLRRINWKASARTSRLQSRVYESNVTPNIALFLDTRTTPPPFWGISHQLLETAMLSAASISGYALDKGYNFGLYVNESHHNSSQLMSFPPSDNPAQQQKVLNALAHVQGFPSANIENVVTREIYNLNWGTTVAVLTSMPGDNLLSVLKHMKSAGRSVALIVIGEAEVNAHGIPVYRIPDNTPWQALETIQIIPEGGL